MRREKYKYSQFPSEGIAGIDKDLAMELACKDEISAHYWITGPVQAYESREDSSFIVELETIVLCSDTLYELDFTECARLDYFKHPAMYNHMGKMRAFNFSTPIQIKRDDVVFFVEELERYAEKRADKRLLPNELSQFDTMLSIAKEIEDRNIRSERTLSQALKFEELQDQATKKLGKNATQKELLSAIRESLPLSFSKDRPSIDTIRKSLSSLKRIRGKLDIN